MDSSECLLNIAKEALYEARIGDNEWAVGGGTVLAYYFNHRKSKDIDIFIPNIQILNKLSPRFNDVCEKAFDYNEMTNYISLTFQEGKIDFIASPQLTLFSPKKEQFYNNKVFLEHPIEIVIKKIFHRGSWAVPRDIFDLATVYNFGEKDKLLDELINIEDEAEKFFNNIYKCKNQLYSNESADMLLPSGKLLEGQEFNICKDIAQNFFDLQQKKNWER